jgi:GNAT superfamily N-acetyltransferase
VFNCSLTAHVEDVCVSQSARSKGIGSKLMAHIRNICLQRGCRKITLVANKELDKFYTLNKYEKRGYQFSQLLSVPGIILVTSCHKHIDTRLKELVLPDNVEGWPRITVIGDPNLASEYTWRKDGILVIRCEDSYFHLLKKIYTALEIITSIYNIEQGALICGDDCVFNLNKMKDFLNISSKTDYIGRVTPSEGPTKMYNTFMSGYFLEHPEECSNPINGIQGVDISRCSILPSAPRIAGTIRYVSLKSIKIVIDFMKSIHWNCFYWDETYGFMTLCEDLGVGAIMHKNGIPLTSYNLVADTEDDFNTGEWVGFTTNRYK